MAALVAHRSFLNNILDRQAERRQLIAPGETFPAQVHIRGRAPQAAPRFGAEDGLTSKDKVVGYVKEEETIRNDYCEWYNATGEYGSNFIMGAGEGEICDEYPALKKLMNLKTQLVAANAHPPLYAPLSPSDSPRDSLFNNFSTCKFDVIRINHVSDWDKVADLPIRQLSADTAVVFLWVGRGDEEGLERGRECFAKWNFRRAEDIVWVKTNKGKNGKRRDGEGAPSGALFASQKEHCLMGIRGTIKRSVDVRFAHCNVDTDVIIWEEPEGDDGPKYPPYLYTLIENFCLGTRRLEIFSQPHLARQGWVTAGLSPFPSPAPTPSGESVPVQIFNPATYPSLVPQSDGKAILPFHPEIDQLRPKSPQRRGPRLGQGGGSGPTGSSNRPSPAPHRMSLGSSGPNTPMVHPNQSFTAHVQPQMQPGFPNPMMMQGMSMEQMMMANMAMGMMGGNMGGQFGGFQPQPQHQGGRGMGINGGQPGFDNPQPQAQFGMAPGFPGMEMQGVTHGMRQMGMGQMGMPHMGMGVQSQPQGYGQFQPQGQMGYQMGPRFHGGWQGQGQ
ncbi:hypothetical protein I350_07669 [Cryptococcus amylolentus CBS 6273]|uniref:Transcription regulator n=1 Tax=Cryptococcus amylolentus CBS 6273 TaxID=1296118 RepID=A0A1E3JB02_9TREE|nr:hypothetical protein I350_07669 [Cryptococcus amylolentus CBS 6273]